MVGLVTFMSEENTFEESLGTLEKLVTDLESGTVPLLESVAAFQKGAQLLAFCQKTLKDAELQVRVLEEVISQES